ncbi:tyrosinase family protein [Caballeronia grimmiae]|uniref:tyrosinase family protein n=1 Tax=Caballeronia grimmiae TaxID=1071679 RepID=UPI0038BAAAD8
MSKIDEIRRTLLKGSAAATMMSLSPLSRSAAVDRTRLEWQVFKTTPQYASFLNAVEVMKAASNPNKPNSWAYWVNVHVKYCPHTKPYFFAWHRGFLYCFEQQLRAVSGDNSLALPFWDYYSYPTIPSEFTDSATGNPLFVSGRVNTDVRGALTMAPFARTIANFQRGTQRSYEASFEAAPHNPIHDIIGGWMADMQSPTDPIFFLHHANVDRLLDAWARTPRARYPAPSSAYWQGSFTYAPGLTMAKSRTYEPSQLNYQYADTRLPTVLPPNAQLGKVIRVQAHAPRMHGRPPVAKFPRTPPRQIKANRRSLGGATNLALDHHSVSALISVSSPDATALQDTVGSSSASPVDSKTQAERKVNGRFKYANIVLDSAAVTALGKQGGYFYNVYVNLPSSGDIDASTESRFVGTVGPFEVSAATHHSDGTLVLPANDALLGLSATELTQVVVSLVRIDGPTSPKGVAMVVGELRIELAADSD